MDEQTLPYDYASDLLLSRGPELTADRSGLPRGRRGVSMTPRRGEGAGFLTRVQAGYVDDLPTEIRILARARFPDLPVEQAERRYGVRDGRPYYVGDDNKTYWETDGAWQYAKNFAAELLANLPSEVLATLGAASPVPGGAAAGAAAGEKVRQVIGKEVFNEPQTTMGNVVRMGAAAVGGQAGKVVGKVLPQKVANAASRMATPPGQQSALGKAARVAKVAGAGWVPDAAEEKRVRTLMQRYGITDPTVVETTGSRRLADRFSLLGDLPATADAVQDIKTTRMGQVSGAVDELLQALSPVADREEAGRMASEAAGKAVKAATDARTAAVSPLYDDAFRTAGPVDTGPAVEALDGLLADLPEEGGSIKPVLEKVRKMLFRTGPVPGLAPAAEAVETAAEEGATVVPRGSFDRLTQRVEVPPERSTVPEYDLRRLDNAKKEIDALLDGSHPKAKDIVPAVKADLERRLVAIRNALVAEADKASPGYAAARAEYARLSPPVEALQKGAVGAVENLSGDQVTQATQRLLDSAFTSPDTVRRASQAIRAQNPDAWNAVVRQYVQRLWDQIPEAAADQTVNYGGRMAGKMSQKGRDKILAAALEHDPAMLQRVTDFQEVLSRTGLLFRRESQTATRQVALKEMEREANKGAVGRVAAVLQTDVSAPGRRIGQWLEATITTPRYQQKLLDALQDPKAAAALARLKRLPPRSLALAQGLATFLGAATGATVPGRLDRATTPDRPAEGR